MPIFSMAAPYRPLACALSLIPFILLLLTAPVGAVDSGGDNEKQIAAALQKRSEATLLAAEILEMVRTARYEAAEDRLDKLLTAKPMAVDGHRLLEKVYFQLAVSDQIGLWDRWCEVRSSSHFPFTIRGMHFYEKARLLDGANRTVLLSARQRREFNVFLNSARVDLEKAHALNDQDPGPTAALTALSLQLQLPRSTMEQWFERTVALDPAWLSGYRAKLLYLAPWWYGSEQKMEQFAWQCFNDAGPGANTYIVALDYLVVRSEKMGKDLHADRFLLDPPIYAMISSGFDRYVQEYPDSHRIQIYQSLLERILQEPYVAIAAFSETLQTDPENKEARRGRITAHLATRQFEQAEADLHALEKFAGETPFSRAGFGEISFLSRQDVEEGGRFFAQAIVEERSSYRRKLYLFRRGDYYQKFGRHRLAIDDFTAALQEDILFEEAYFGRAQSRYALNDTEGALADLVVIKSRSRGKLTTRARSLINIYLQPKAAVSSSRQLKGEEYPGSNLEQKSPVAKADEALSEPDQAYRDYLVRGINNYYLGEFAQARENFDRVIAASPASSKPYFMLGRIAEEQDNDWLKACTYYEKAYQLAADVVDYQLAQAKCLYTQRRFSEVAGLLSRSIDDPGTPPTAPQTAARIHLLRSLSLQEMGLNPEAHRDMQLTSTFDPELQETEVLGKPMAKQIEIGSLVQINGDTDQNASSNLARSYIDYAQQQQLEQGHRQLLDGDIDGATNSYLKAIRTNPHNSEPYNHLGNLYFRHKQDYERAQIYYSQAIDRDPSIARYFFDRGAIHYYFKQYDPAIIDFSTVLELQPENGPARYYRGVCHHMLGQIEEALQDFQTLLQADKSWETEIQRFRNAWSAEIEQFLQATQ